MLREWRRRVVRRILVAEDDAEIRQALTDMIEISGYQVRAVANGAEALDMLATWRPDAIILDMLMPEMDGPAFLERLRAWDDGAAIPVILLSAMRDLASRTSGLPVAAVVAKPFDVDDLQSTLDRIWKER
jgi:two-component system response regulator MprA